METDIHDYPHKPIGGTNPYHCCSLCGRSTPEVYNHLEKHNPYCLYRRGKEALLTKSSESMLTVLVELEDLMAEDDTLTWPTYPLRKELGVCLFGTYVGPG